MRLGTFDCGCDDRRFIMFEAGRLGMTQAAILAVTLSAILIIARKVGP